MDIHQNARLTRHGRAELVRRVLVLGQAPKAVATALGLHVKTVNKWCARFEAEGAAGLIARSSRPHRLRQPTPDAVVERIATLRRQYWICDRIARQVGVSRATVSRVLRRLGLSRVKDLAPAAPIRRYERAPHALAHLHARGLLERVHCDEPGLRQGSRRRRHRASRLQLAQDRAARQALERSLALPAVDHSRLPTAYAAMPARAALERGSWKEATDVALQPSADSYPWSK